jgi:1A family penicillin-binding protein
MKFKREYIIPVFKTIIIAGAFCVGIFTLWAATLSIPNLDNFEERNALRSTRIFDRTGKILLFDFNQDVRRTVIPLEEVSDYIKEAAIAVEDDEFYNHNGVRPLSFIRALIVNIRDKDFTQGGSTITQQIVKNSLLSRDKIISRKVKEWVLALKIERKLTKDEILRIYLNENPYGGTIYGVEEASLNFFGKSAKDVNLVEAAYLAALPQAPTFYSPYGNNKDKLEERKNFVLFRMHEEGYITKEEMEEAQSQTVTFLPIKDEGIKAPHFVFMIREYLEKKYGNEAIEKGELKVITTIDYKLQEKAEEIVARYGAQNAVAFNASNAALVAIDPENGQILSLVGSRDFFNNEIQGQYNSARALRQPGSSFKPFIYATAFKKGYTPETVVFDLPTQFSTACAPDNFTSEDGCYSPQNYDNTFRGPVTFRNALAQSLNIPAVKAFYLAGLNDSVQTARDLGITSLGDIARYGLTLVLGGGEVSLLEMTNAYAVFASDGEFNQHSGILRVEDINGKVLEEFKKNPRRALDSEIAREINNILSDNNARTPAFGPNSYLNIPGRSVAAKTGTTNNYKDAWIIGYSPSIVVGAWAGNNDSTSMEKRVAGMIIAPLWNEFMQIALNKVPQKSFTPPSRDYSGLKPVLQGQWMEPNNPHEILHWVQRNNPRGPYPSNPSSDAQYPLWEYSIRNWLSSSEQENNSGDVTDEEINEIINRIELQLNGNIQEEIPTDESESNSSL